MTETIVPFEELAPEMGTSAGGKGGTLARLYQSGYPVPNGLVILPAAFTQHELGPDTLSAEVWARVQIHLARLRGDDPQAAPHEFSLSRPRGRYDGPAELKRFARRLCRLARRLEADPDRRDDVFDSHGLLPKLTLTASNENVILGMPGSAGRVEGCVRRLDRPDGEAGLEQGEILVTKQTNIGWTLLFPRAAAIVTDVGAPLSHAAIVARELGIPAVVNCGDASARLKTGDRVRVDGTAGAVEFLEAG